MSLSWGRMYALVRKELQDLIRNAQLLIMVFTPVIMAFIFSQISGMQEEPAAFLVPVLMAFTMTGIFVQSMVIAEEKEKHTLRVLMLSPASAVEVLLGKSLISIIMTVVAVVACVLILGGVIGSPLLFVLMVVLCTLVFVALGTIVGLLSKSLSDTSYTGLPIMMIFMAGPSFAPMIESDWLTSIVSIFPTQHFMEGTEQLRQGGGFPDIGAHLINMSIWLVVAVLIALITYRRNQLDS